MLDARRLPKSFVMSLEALNLFFTHPILWIYATLWFFLMHMSLSPVSVAVMLFVNCCLARHAMHILQRQSVRWYEPTLWVVRHCIQWCMSMFLTSILFLVGVDLLIRMANAHVSLYLSISTLIVVICAVALVSLVEPIVATECFGRKDIMFGPIQRSVRIVWQHVGPYVSMLLGIGVCIMLLVGIDRVGDMLFVHVFAWSSKPVTTFVLMLCVVQVVMAHTLFYYEFYKKHEKSDVIVGL